jgi:outer membrane murein-binding lipoprotein Lpp
MKKFFIFFVVLAVLAGASLLVSCNSNEPKNKAAKEDQDFSSSGMIKEMEEMQKAADRGKPAAQPQPAATQQPAAPQAPKK